MRLHPGYGYFSLSPGPGGEGRGEGVIYRGIVMELRKSQ